MFKDLLDFLSPKLFSYVSFHKYTSYISQGHEFQNLENSFMMVSAAFTLNSMPGQAWPIFMDSSIRFSAHTCQMPITWPGNLGKHLSFHIYRREIVVSKMSVCYEHSMRFEFVKAYLTVSGTQQIPVHFHSFINCLYTLKIRNCLIGNFLL